MAKTYKNITINGVNFELNTKGTVMNPVIFYKSVYDVYGRCSVAKQRIWDSWAKWFNECNSHMYGVTSHNCHFFSIAGCVTWIDEETGEAVEYYLKITPAHNFAWRVERV